jgi:hypothetical protein
MAAIRAEMPRISVAFASVGLGHGVFTMERWEKSKKRERQNLFVVENLKRGQGIRVVQKKSLKSYQLIINAVLEQLDHSRRRRADKSDLWTN